jgi:DNA invertase Pin-like site-specific DNA recombinase
MTHQTRFSGTRAAVAPPKPSALREIGVIACYCRVSSARQKSDSQKPEIRRWLQGNGIDPSTAEWFEDKETGQNLKRPASDRLQKAVFAGRVKMVVVWKLDRISRRQRDGVNLMAEWCERGVRVVAVTQQIDLSGAVGRMVASVLFGLAEIESEYRRERQAAGIAVAKERGVYRGRQRGTTKAPARRAHELRGHGLTVQEIATALGVSRRTAGRAATPPVRRPCEAAPAPAPGRHA